MQEHHNNSISMILGAITAAGIGSILFQASIALILGVMGALGGYVFNRFIKPRVDKLFSKKKGE